MLSWIGDSFDATEDEPQTALTTAFYKEAVQNIPSIACCEDSDSEADVEEILFSSVNTSDGSQPIGAQSSHFASCQSPAPFQYSWQPDTPVQTHSSPGVGISRRSISATASQAHQHDVQKSSAAKAKLGFSRGEVDEGSIASATVGWFTGAAGQLAASRPGKVNLSEQSNPLIDMHAGMSSVTEEEVERAFQQAVLSSSVPEVVSPGVQLATAIHDTEIDRLLQKLVCGEVEYNPHDPSSGLPPASSLFTDSEASSEAEEEKAAASGHATAHRVPDAATVHSSKRPPQHQQAPGANATGRHALERASESEKMQQRPKSQQVCVSNHQATSQTKTITGTYIRHRQTSRLANRFQRQNDYDAESGVAEEFDDWRSARAKLKSTPQQ
ncbi:hypothetical protein WJX77_006651 [Trebouxia sp. C0004]